MSPEVPRRPASVDWGSVRDRLERASAYASSSGGLAPEDERALLVARSQHLARVPSRAARADELLSVLIFSIAKQPFAISTHYVHGITRTISESLRRMTTMTTELLASTRQQASGAEEQSSAVTETVTTVNEVVTTAEQAAQRAYEVATSAELSNDIGRRGIEALNVALEVLETAAAQMESVSVNTEALAEQTQAIGENIAAVNDISEQTHFSSVCTIRQASRGLGDVA